MNISTVVWVILGAIAVFAVLPIAKGLLARRRGQKLRSIP